MIIYTVKPGDSLFTIGQRYGVPVNELQRGNQLEDWQSLMPGQALVVPIDSSMHTVQPGESLYSIASLYATTLDRLIQLNPEISNPAQIRPGMSVIVPQQAAPTRSIVVNGYALPTISLETLNSTLPHLTFLSIFSYEARADGSIVPLNDSAMIAAAYRQAVAPLLSLTNISEEGDFDSDLAHVILTDEAVQNTLLRNVMEEMNARSYFGLNLDFEYIYPEDREAYNAFLIKARDMLHPLGYRLLTALAPKTYTDQPGLLYEAHDYAAHGSVADWVILMTYEWGYTYGPPMSVAPLSEVEKVIKYAVSVIPSQKILMGMPNYGYNWTLPFDSSRPAQAISNANAVRLASQEGVNIQFDPVAQTPHFNYTDEGVRHEVWFDDARSIHAKLGLVEKYDLGGVSYWNINRYFAQNWQVLRSMYDVTKMF